MNIIHIIDNKSADKVKKILFSIDQANITTKQWEAVVSAIDFIDNAQIEGTIN